MIWHSFIKNSLEELFSRIRIAVLMNSMIWHSFSIVFLDLTIGCILSSEWNYMSKLRKLMHIDLSWNVFEKDILRFLGGALPDLKSVDLSHNEMQGPLSSKGAYIYF